MASAPLGRNDELLFSCTEVNLPKSGPKIPEITIQAITTSIAIANGLRFFVAGVDTALSAFLTVKSAGLARRQAYL